MSIAIYILISYLSISIPLYIARKIVDAIVNYFIERIKKELEL